MSPNADILRPDNVLALAASALRGDGTTASGLKSPAEAVALVGHASMVAVGFKLIGLGEEHRISSSSDSPSLPLEWNTNDTLVFRYSHPQSSMQYLLKVSRLGNNAVILALALGDDRTTSLDIAAKDFISTSSLPTTSDADPTSDRLSDIFVSSSRLADLITLFKINVIQKLTPGVYKEEYDASSQASQEPRGVRPQPRNPLADDPLPQPGRPYPFDDPLAAAPCRPVPPGDFPPPGFEDEYEIKRPPQGYRPGFDGRNPLNGGDRNLYPPGIGPHDPLRGGVGGGSEGGMHPTFDDPVFDGGARGGGYDPQVPSGARYDPVGPGGALFGRGRGLFGRGGAGGGFGGFGGDIT